MRRMVISGSSALADRMNHWKSHCEGLGFTILDYPALMSERSFDEDFPEVNRKFYKAIGESDMLFVANEEKNNKPAYIGAGVFAEISFAIGLNFTRGRRIEIFILNRPPEESHFYEDVTRWEKYGWIKIGSPEFGESNNR